MPESTPSAFTPPPGAPDRRPRRRFVAKDDDPALLDLLTSAAQPAGEQAHARSSGFGNQVTPSPV
jgi:hypothetical protein